MDVGLAYKRDMGEIPAGLDFNYLEVSPENWIGREEELKILAESHPLVAHGLSLSIGSVDPLDIDYVKQIRKFMDEFNIDIYTDHLSFCSYQGHLYDLMPLPFTEEAITHTADRISIVQDILGRKIGMENISYYGNTPGEMGEPEFITEVCQESGCGIHLDVNNIFVNSVNHKDYTPTEFIDRLQGEVIYYHNAGHYWEEPEFIIDSHGAPITEQSMDTLKLAYNKFGIAPTTIERDFNIPQLEELNEEAKWTWKIIKEVSRTTSVGNQQQNLLNESMFIDDFSIAI